MTTRASALNADQRAERLQAALDKITAAVDRLATGDDWQAWLALSSRLARRHHYSARNTLLLWQQAMLRGTDLSVLGGYRWWLSVGRQVRHGEHGYQVLAPLTRRVDHDDTDRPDPVPTDRPTPTRRAVVGFRIETVFDLAQTDGEGDPTFPPMVMPSGDGPVGAWDAIAQMLTGAGWTVEREPIIGETQGFTHWATRRVVVRPDLEPAAAVYVLAHEAAHVRLHEGSDLPRNVKEVEADSVAYLVTDALGLDAAGATFPYVTGWSSGDPAAVLAVAGRVTDAAAAILDALTPPEPAASAVVAPTGSPAVARLPERVAA